MRFALRRSLPGVAIALLLGVALLAPVRRVGADRSLPQDDLYFPQCTLLDQGGSGTTTLFSSGIGEGFRQPLPFAGNVSSCSLAVQPFTGANIVVDLVAWDPATVAPEAGSIALRSSMFSTTVLAMNASRTDLFPPLVLRALTNVAEPPPSNIALEYRVSSNGYTPHVQTQLAADDETGAPVAQRILADGSITSFAGSHPVVPFTMCGGSDAFQQMRVVQSVMTTDIDLAPVTEELIQKFQVPVATQLAWVEFALDRANWSAPLDYGRVRIVDAEGQATPPIEYGTPLADANFIADTRFPWVPLWFSHFDFSTSPILAAYHDYWLVLTTNFDYLPMGRALTGTESPYFKTAIGPLFARGGATLPAADIPGRVLAFRIIGTPLGTVGIGPHPRALADFALRVAPNPSRGAASISWGGTLGTVTLEVLDPRGRRVASATSDADRWSWNAVGADGRALPAGVYFLQAHDGAGRLATARVTLVR